MATGLAISLAGALLKGIAGKVGALIFDEVFPPGVPSYFDQVYDEIKKIVHQEITQNTISEMDGEINGLKDWVQNTYTPRRESQPPTPKQDLFDLLSPKEGDLTISVIGVLQQENFAEAGLGVFMIAAGMHLAILQELAYVDPNTDDPQESSYVKSIKKWAQHYADYATKTYNTVEIKRVAYVDFKEGELGPLPVVTFGWKDDYTKEDYTTYAIIFDPVEAEKKAVESMQEHIAKVKSKLDSDLNDPKGTAAMWRKLVEQPLVKL